VFSQFVEAYFNGLFLWSTTRLDSSFVYLVEEQLEYFYLILGSGLTIVGVSLALGFIVSKEGR
jgi:hypothetical protein